MKVSIDGQEIESLTVELTDTEGKTSSHSISANVFTRALTGEFGTSMREMSLTTERLKWGKSEKR